MFDFPDGFFKRPPAKCLVSALIYKKQNDQIEGSHSVVTLLWLDNAKKDYVTTLFVYGRARHDTFEI